MTIEQAREKWATVAKYNGWYTTPLYIQVWVDADGNVVDAVSFKGMTEDIIIRDEAEVDGQEYTDCIECDWFGIPIIDDGAPEKCNACLAAEHARLVQAAQEAKTEEERETALDDARECADDLDYFFKRQLVLEPSERRSNAVEVTAGAKDLLPEEDEG